MEERLRIGERDLYTHTRLVQLEGELELETASLLKKHLGDEQLSDTRRLIIDLSELRFMDSTGMRTLLQLQQRVLLNGGKLSLVCGNPGILRAFEVAGLLRTFDLCRTLDDALVVERAIVDGEPRAAAS
jgi:anti-sigma B factor antagonist